MKAELLSFADGEAWKAAFVRIALVELGAAAASGRRGFHAALAGGRTPGPLYRALAASPEAAASGIAFHVWIGDERALPASDPERNGRLVAECFSEARSWPRPPVLHLWPEGGREAACAGYAAELVTVLGPRPRFDLCVLGMGADGHTAGLFGLDQVRKAGSALALPTEAPSEPRLRMSLGPSALGASRRIVVALSGREKRAMLDAILAGLEAPLSAVAGDVATILYLEA